MHLKSLTVRGFKSFASATTFDFEPGVTAVVGPNGSGKSNVVDALSWVMGEQGAKTLRGGKMEDVIFAGTAKRPPLGRAHVSLTIDNADGALPIEYTEVTIARTLFRAGGSEYSINGTSCRLLDIQELLSDSGLGREMHVIVGQGQLDKILHATPEDRRGFIEEAAGILKHRRRREKTVRKLESMQANLARLTDLTGEVRRQLTPLGKQADVARRAQQVQFDVRDARARLLADELVQLSTTLHKETADEAALKERRKHTELMLDACRLRQSELEGGAAKTTPAANAARDIWYHLGSIQERFRSLEARAVDRHQLLSATEPAREAGRDPEHLAQDAKRLRSEEVTLTQTLDTLRRILENSTQERTTAEHAATAEEQRLTILLRAAADRREGLARLTGQVGTARSRVESAEAELGRLLESIEQAHERRSAAHSDFAVLESQVAGAEEGEESLDAAYEDAQEKLDAATAHLTRLREEQHTAERERDSLIARREALETGLQRKDGTGLLLESDLNGVLGTVVEHLTINPGYETAIAAALGNSAEALAVTGQDIAVQALEQLKDNDAGRASMLLAPIDGIGPSSRAAKLPDDVRSALSYVGVVASVEPAVRALLAGVVIVDTLAEGADVVVRYPHLTAVTTAGDLLSALTVQGGSASAPGLLELQATVDETVRRLEAASARAEQTRFTIKAAETRGEEARNQTNAALEVLNESDAGLAAIAEKLGNLGSALRNANDEATRLQQRLAVVESNVETEKSRLAEVLDRLAAAQESPEEEEPSTDQRDELTIRARAARESELEARLDLRSSEEQLVALGTRAASLERSAEAELQAREAAAQRARVRAGQARSAANVAHGVGLVLESIGRSLSAAARDRDAAEEARAGVEQELQQIRATNQELETNLAALTDSVHRDELIRAEQRLRIEALEARALDELGLTSDHLVSEYGPEVPVPESAKTTDKWAALRTAVDDDGNALPEGKPFVRAEQEKRLKRAERDLSSLGRVNPLALEEFAAMEERHQYLSTQLEDLKATRKDLLNIIRQVDERVEQVFSEAFRDTAEQFERVFGRLFPGGEGRLILTDPADMLTTGIDVEARPAGKRIKRLSLLSGGERSLTAVALLVAIFKARPSPFYVMDEVEAALDDTNLGRLITVFEELRESSQLIIITHQKRTMEIADALYGVTMRGDGVTTVISQRLADAV
ncbi:chromosome segregation protein SMC [Arthrobacter roseus]|uniref:chromosome segregation protein SMC n=1 Tax=Arthrobacter roseus TaxID=136274 RepID=UPI001965E95A|nr:chromosome segregation protein SMC [Arthrobacter roseus]MBM7848863.1 chromosome segregation protein [Arthrobacter roseus]